MDTGLRRYDDRWSCPTKKAPDFHRVFLDLEIKSLCFFNGTMSKRAAGDLSRMPRRALPERVYSGHKKDPTRFCGVFYLEQSLLKFNGSCIRGQFQIKLFYHIPVIAWRKSVFVPDCISVAQFSAQLLAQVSPLGTANHTQIFLPALLLLF